MKIIIGVVVAALAFIATLVASSYCMDAISSQSDIGVAIGALGIAFLIIIWAWMIISACRLAYKKGVHK